MEFRVPYGRKHLTFVLPDELHAGLISPAQVAPAPDPIRAVNDALGALLGGKRWADFAGARSAAVAVNDKTRPVPHKVLLPPLLARLEAMDISRDSITILVAVGTHPPMPSSEFADILPPEVLQRYRVLSHDPDDQENLVYQGQTRRGTPVWVNRRFAQADLRIVVGNIEPHQFQGFSGGYKTAAIGLAGRDTVNHNHAMMTDPNAAPCCFEDNPPRQDIEEIGRLIGVHLALNAVVNEGKQIIAVLAGDPARVMSRGLPLARKIYQVPVAGLFDLIIASPGGHPKDINLYQAQKALAHASLAMKDGGTVVLVAACPEGSGSASYERWLSTTDWESSGWGKDRMVSRAAYEAVIERFKREGFCVGPHKAYLIARDALRVRTLILSEMPPDFVRRLLLNPVASLNEALSLALGDLPPGARVGVMSAANSTIPMMREA